ncbi:MAG: mismatch repair protein MutS, partial [Pseudomonadota bacterium]
IEVASLAGIPATVVRDARRTLLELEAQSVHHSQNTQDSNNQSDFFDTEDAVPEVAENTAAQITGIELALIEKLSTLDPDSLTPRQALDALYHLKNISKH